MNIDIINFTEAQYATLNYEQRKILYAAQEKKNALQKQLDTDRENAKLQLIANGTARSNMLSLLYLELGDEYDRAVSDLRTVTLDAIVNAIDPSDSSGDTTEGSSSVETNEVVYNPSNPDNSLSYADRFRLVKEYYMQIEDPAQRYTAFLGDSVAEDYLGEYYFTMKYYLESFL